MEAGCFVLPKIYRVISRGSVVYPREQYSLTFHSLELTVKWEGDKLELFEQVSLHKAVQPRCFGTFRVSEI